jgi:alanine-glyoxylate transaminase/serine-glyoxylate transaminase/serine-pyruvate transaminase
VRRAVERWRAEGALEFNVTEPAERSNSVTMVRMHGGHDPDALRAYCTGKLGVVLGTALGELKGKGFRIAHMGHVNAPMILGTLGAIETGLVALGVPHGRGGVQAAIDFLGHSVPR